MVVMIPPIIKALLTLGVGVAGIILILRQQRNNSTTYRQMTYEAPSSTSRETRRFKHSNVKDCRICLDCFSHNKPAFLLPCNHKFHKECLTKLVEAHMSVCPLCRKQFSLQNIKHAENITECCICNEDIDNNEIASVLPCKHEVHKNCHDILKRVEGQCPSCSNKSLRQETTENAEKNMFVSLRQYIA